MRHGTARARWVATVALTAVASAATVLLVTSGIAAGSSSSAQYEYGHPAPVSPPAISGTPQVGQTLTTSNGTWSSSTTITLYGYRWGRCDAKGGGCVQIPGAGSNTYVLQQADQGHTIRAYVSATNAAGSTEAFSTPTAVIQAAPAGSSGGGNASGSVIAAESVKLPDRLVIDKVSYSQNPIHSRQGATQMRVHVSDRNDKSVSGALVYSIGVPYSRILGMPEVRTDASGWATLQIQPGQFFPRKGYLVLFVRARVAGQDLLGGTSTRRLVQVTIGAPNGT